MKNNMKADAVISQTFYSRIRAVEALRTLGAGDPFKPEDLLAIGAELDEASLRYGRAATATTYSALAGLLRLIASLTEWREGVLAASDGVERFLRSACERYRIWHNEYCKQEASKLLVIASDSLPRITSFSDFEKLCMALAAVPLPVGVFSKGSQRVSKYNDEKTLPPPPAELSVAFLKFQIDGRSAGSIHHLTPLELHDLEIEVRVSRWPESAEVLRLTPISTELRGSYELSEFVFDKPEGDPPYTLFQRGRAALQLAQGLNARPYEFKYSAAFEPISSEQPVAIVGHRTLLIEGLDVRSNPITGYQLVDQKILRIRDSLRQNGLVASNELSDVLQVLTVLGGVAGRAIQDAEFDGVWSEAQFQSAIRKELRRNPQIGSELDEHPKASGGITDLSYRGIVIELKSLPAGVKALDDCQAYVEQTASYAVAKEKRIAVLCVLDCSTKTAAPWPAAESITILKSQPPAEVSVITIVVQGNITRPSKLSR
ncbi:hypothetical protein VSO52_19335 [Pseudomonas fulva]|uniref:hypothetical protein n=1 Tax=Pseudomonas fulva TaxID=47880 RepID=UPI002DB63D00|nr:hypothetical protein [Pseudomonas fulva]MEC4024917.1 hypothetical protein [Pseudomonas fulva]